MRIYRSTCTYIWNDNRFPFVSDDCQLVWFHIFTNPLSSPLGVFRAALSGLAEDKNRNGRWPFPRYMKGFQEALREGFIKHDEQALLISFPKYFAPDNHCNHPRSPNVVTSWGFLFRELPDSALKRDCYQSLQRLVEGKGKAFTEAFLTAFGECSSHASPNRDPNPEPDPKHERGKEKTRKISGALQVITPGNDGIVTWSAYSTAFRRRYEVDPVRNARVNSAIKQVVQRLGHEDAPLVAVFYLTLNDPFYVQARHSVALLLRDCETLHTRFVSKAIAPTPAKSMVDFLARQFPTQPKEQAQ